MKPILLLGLMMPLTALAQSLPAFVPLPAKVEANAGGRFRLEASTTISAPSGLKGEASWLAERLKAGLQREVPVLGEGGSIRLMLDESLPADGYRLIVAPGGVGIRGGSPAGVFYGAVTFLQGLPAAVFGSGYDETLQRAKADWSVPAMTVEDAPAMPWRGLHLDSARHFQPKEWIFKLLESMAAHKLNTLHWHLVDNEAWRLEIRKYPKLVEVHQPYPARYIDEIPTNPTTKAVFRYGYFHGGGHYTQQDVREIVAFAAARHITIVPEIEFPGHSQAALTAYPEFSTTRKVPVVRSSHSPDLIGVHPEALQFLKNVLDETMELFPGPYIHFGGDEAPKVQWKESAEVQAKIDELGLRIRDSKEKDASESALQAWMFNQLAAYIGAKGRKAVGWEEIMHGHNLEHLAKGAVVMPWLSARNGAVAANAGYGVVHVSTFPFYLDSYQSDHPGEPDTLYGGAQGPDRIYQFPLYPKELTPEGRKNILGAQAQLWTELMPRTDDIEYQAFPRVCALAELTWTAEEGRKSTADFMTRLAAHGARLSALGLNHRRVAPPAGLEWTPEFLAGGGEWKVAVPAEIAGRLAQGGALRVSFEYGKGANGLDIREVSVREGTRTLARDAHEGFTGSNPRDNHYTLEVPAGPSDRALILQIGAKGAGGGDSTGTVKLEVR